MVATRYQTAFKLYPYKKVEAQDGAAVRHPVVIVGGGPIGLALALDLGLKGTPALVLDDHDGAGLGSKAICFAKRTLDIANRMGAGQAMVDKGVVWNVGKVFHDDRKVFDFNLLPEDGHRNPAFINLQQPYFEKYFVDAITDAQAKGAPIEIRGRNCVTAVENHGDFSTLTVDTPDGPYQIEADYLIACDGARSPIRDMMGLTFDGRVFEDNFLIADVHMKADFPTERWFWFEPPFKGSGQSALLHKQPDDIWRIDFQLGWDIDRDHELDPDRIRARVDAMLASQAGEVPQYELEWTSIYTFQCRRMEKFRHGNVIFAGDSAHQVSPFGARGANSGVQDTDNLAWKLDLVLKGLADDSLLDTYATEREHGADENILNSTRATDFLTPKSEVSKSFRNAVLELANKHAFARPLVNSGRLSVPCNYVGFPLFGEDALNGPEATQPGMTCPDAPFGDSFVLEHLGGGFTVLAIGCAATDVDAHGITAKALNIPSPSGALKSRYLGGAAQAVYLIRPDQHVVARWANFDAGAIAAAIQTAIGKG
ncbi:FAD-dependent oxidoreductase [Sulfitobacter donghicola]|uniref:FAD-dependent oxidoreductase n=1 Tax=Sulfitobacter donghicola DSW-25 = KCTC 12864 = JCM 14565 TaxID=1300350 RepID=A0A073IG22_9RHOB|nr:FAD-dependent oxidoreductase [Sulfitobacter donghicola]KEJ88724.1 FAD-dependent oxidoreductase [Sulfitobacter donghicola DSW-25 = KCTC 12864 = JCM 14565]KIN68505.1 Monooxygenase FAD-binding protein [Sulfitobacter donghicola DSW-25 = KCTC 12864 = JCM 14565]